MTSRERKIISLCLAILLSLVVAVIAALLKNGSGGTSLDCIVYGAGAFVTSFTVCMLVLMFLLA
ncbi:hypothetical protein [Streptomyces goshikiensis]|uniref:hypothetical protein n=1 Tax=Streptomyces goshikiensis TaxID=1942 RepID=UPI0037A60B92